MANRYFADLSNNNDRYDAAAYKQAGHILIALKASEGLSFADPKHRGWALASGLHHIAVVHYHFARPDLGNDPRAEARHFLNCVHGLVGPYDYLVCDVERATPQGWSHDPAWSRGFDEEIQARTRFHTILYASRSVLQKSDQWLVGNNLRVWDAAYSTEPDFAPRGYAVAFRQFTDGQVGPEPHSFAGIGECDGNRVSQSIYRHLLGNA